MSGHQPARPLRLLLWPLLPGATAFALATILLIWLTVPTAPRLTQRLPGQDDPHNLRQGGQIARLPKGELTTGSGKPSDISATWPQFRGPARSAISSEPLALARSWPAQGPRELWTVALGEGYAAAAVRHGRVYVFDYDMNAKRDALRCLSLDDGAEIWRYSYPMPAKRNHGISRTVSAVNESYVVSLSPRCLVLCNDARTGELKWMIDLKQIYGATEPLWYAGQCPLIEENTVILAPGGPEALLVALDCATGKEIWKTPNPDGWKMSHSSVMPYERGGKRAYMYMPLGGVVGVDAQDGRLLWKSNAFTMHTVSPSPLQLSADRFLLTAGYDRGSGILELSGDGAGTEARLIRSTRPREFGSEQQTPILYEGHIYAVLPKPRQELVCMDQDLNPVWASGPSETFGLGPYLIAGGLIYILDDSGTLTLAEATPQGYKRLARAKVLQGHDSWGPMALAQGRLLVRDMQRMVCLDVAAPETRR